MYYSKAKSVEFNNKRFNDLNVIMETAKYLKSARIERSLTITELSKLLNLSQQQIFKYENGNPIISIENFDAYLKVLGKNWHDYFKSVIKN